jgi:hypothetical protein
MIIPFFCTSLCFSVLIAAFFYINSRFPLFLLYIFAFPVPFPFLCYSLPIIFVQLQISIHSRPLKCVSALSVLSFFRVYRCFHLRIIVVSFWFSHYPPLICHLMSSRFLSLGTILHAAAI